MTLTRRVLSIWPIQDSMDVDIKSTHPLSNDLILYPALLGYLLACHIRNYDNILQEQLAITVARRVR